MTISPQLLMQFAPLLLQAINKSGGINEFPNLINALGNGYDPGLMQDRLLPLQRQLANNPSISGVDVLENFYTEPGIDAAFPSDGMGSDLSNLFSHLNTEERQMVGGPSAALSAATFENSPMPDDEFLAGFDEQPTTQENLPWSDSDMDDIHSSEMWESGKKFNPSLKEWYKKNKR